MKNWIIVFAIILTSFWNVKAQNTPPKKVSVVGAARGQFYADQYIPDGEDSVTSPKMNSGNVLADLGLKIQANPQMEVLGMVRIRNDYGGFWGSGVSFDVRQLYVRGIIGNAVRYQLGDINYRMTPYTLWNNDQELLSSLPVAFSTQTQAVNYDHFYNSDHSWRQQGASGNVGFLFAKGIKEIKLNAVTTRMRTSDFSNQSDRIFVGSNATIVQSDVLTLGLNYANVVDIFGTSRNLTSYHNPVFTGSLLWSKVTNLGSWQGSGEAGISNTYTNGTELPIKNGKFNDWKLKWITKNNHWQWQVRYHYVNAAFRSPGAQTRRLNPNGQLSAYPRVQNDQGLRPVNMLDMMRETGIYNLQLQTDLMSYLPQYDNITPYGDATPNRQSYEISTQYGHAESWWYGSVLYYRGRETKGEGTIEPRQFTRLQLETGWLFNEHTSGWKSQLRISSKFRKDQTTRVSPEYLPQLNLANEMTSLGMEWLFQKKWELLLGLQHVRYEGLELQSVKDFNGEIINFKELNLDGKEEMLSAGVRYHFSKQSYLSLQRFQWKGENKELEQGNYAWGQWMLMYQMNF
jgi:hypothetical protein